MIVRPAQAADVPAIVELLHTRMNRKIAPERWRRLFDYAWLADKPDYGRVAVADGQLVGFVGALYADRTIARRPERLVNICAWYLDKAHRGRGAGRELMAAATANPDWHYTINTSSSRTVDILEAVGFTVLDAARYDWRRKGRADLAVEWDAARILDRATNTQRELLEDHADLPVMPALVGHDAGETLVVFAVTRKGDDQPWFDVLHVGDPDLLAAHGQAVADAVLPSDDAVLSADARFCSATPAGARRVTLPVPRFVKSARLAGHHVDHLYTELQVLGLKLD